MNLNKKNLEYFQEKLKESDGFWQRLSNPDVFGKKVLDVGCGHGALCIDMARKGSMKVVGVDIDQERIDFAQKNEKSNYNKLSSRLDFKCVDIFNLPDSDFDIIVSKDSFEHIIDLEREFKEMVKKLRKGGRLCIGFGPLYNSPYGGHGRMKNIFPWEHLILSEKFLLRRANKYLEKRAHSIEEMGLNKWSLKDYEKLIQDSGLRIEYFKTNVSNKLVSRVFSFFGKLPFLREYFTHNFYCVL